MAKTKANVRTDHFLGLYNKDNARFEAIRDFLEEETGRPVSATRVVLYLMAIKEAADKKGVKVPASMENIVV